MTEPASIGDTDARFDALVKHMLEGFGRFDLGINDADVRLALAALSSAIADPAAMMMTMKEKAAWSGNARILKDAIERSMLDSGKTLRPFPT